MGGGGEVQVTSVETRYQPDAGWLAATITTKNFRMIPASYLLLLFLFTLTPRLVVLQLQSLSQDVRFVSIFGNFFLKNRGEGLNSVIKQHFKF